MSDRKTKGIKMLKQLKFLDKRLLGVFAILSITILSFFSSLIVLEQSFHMNHLAFVMFIRVALSFLIYNEYKISWSSGTTRSYLIKIITGVVAFLIYAPVFFVVFQHSGIIINILVLELLFYLFYQNTLMSLYSHMIKRGNTKKKMKNAVIYGAGRAGLKIMNEFADTDYRVGNFIDDNTMLQQRSIDGINVVSKDRFINLVKLSKSLNNDMLVIAMPSLEDKGIIKSIFEELSPYFKEIKILPTIERILENKSFFTQLKEVDVKDLLARNPKDLDEEKINSFIKGKVVLVTGAGGSIGSEICQQCCNYEAERVIMVDHSEFNLYTVNEQLECHDTVPVLQSVLDAENLNKTFEKYKPDIVIHAAAYKHVPMVEYNKTEGIKNNVLGTQNCIDIAIKHHVKKFVLISTDKAVRPTSVMGATKRIAELYAQNSNWNGTEICSVRFGNVLGSSGSVIPKFKKQISEGGPVTITHPDITRYFMLIPEACQLVLQAAAIGKGGDILILDMGESVKIVDLAKNLIKLSGNTEVEIEFTGLRPGEKLYEELLINESDKTTEYNSITIAKEHKYDLQQLKMDIKELLTTEDKLQKIKEIVPEFIHADLKKAAKTQYAKDHEHPKNLIAVSDYDHSELIPAMSYREKVSMIIAG
jgi:UDP-N-acetyl-D-glucosamine 4,6-dehydratase